MTQQQFNPTRAQIEAAQFLFIAMAFRDITNKAFDNFGRQVLSSGKYRYEEKYRVEQGAEFITNPKHDYLMQGIREYGQPDKYNGSDADRYTSEMRRKALNAGFVNGENAACMADNDVIKLETAFIKETQPIHGINPEDIVMLEHRKQLIKLTLQLFAPLVNNNQMNEAKRKYFNERINQLEAA